MKISTSLCRMIQGFGSSGDPSNKPEPCSVDVAVSLTRNLMVLAWREPHRLGLRVLVDKWLEDLE